MIPVIVIRAEPGCDASVSAAREMGLDAHGHPLFEVSPVAWEPPDPQGVDALLIGSANALRHAGAALSAFRGKPAYAVGEATARAARAAELDVVAAGEDGLQAVLDTVQAKHRRLLRLAGEARVELSPPEGFTIAERVVYRSEPRAMTPELVKLLGAPAIVLLHSAQAARHFAEQCDANGLDRSAIRVAAIGPRVAQAAGIGWARIATAEKPGDKPLLALADQMCQEPDGAQLTDDENARTDPMQDGYSNPTLPAARPSLSGRTILLVALFAFLVGAGLTGWLAARGGLDFAAPFTGSSDTDASAPADMGESPSGAQAAADAGGSPALDELGSVETRLALLEDRLSRLNLQANAASGNAARAEGLLIAFATRRMTDKGAKLGYLEDQLKLRFANAQPLAVGTIISFAREPVTLDELGGRLDALVPELVGTPGNPSTWGWIKQEVSSLFVVRRSSTPSMTVEERVERARMKLRAGKVDEAIDIVEHLPGSESAAAWVNDAHRYAAAQRALDVIETTAMLEPRRLQDSEGRKVDQPSPLAQPADAVKEQP